MLPLNALDSFKSAAFPDRSITDPSKKTPAWIAQFAKAGVSEFARSRPRWRMWAHDEDIADNIRYANGEQDTQQYRRFAGGGDRLDGNSIEATNRDGHFEGYDETGRGEGAYTARHGGSSGPADPMGLDSIINAQPLPVLPVKLQALKALIIQRYETNITALGQKAKKERAEHEAEMRLWMDLGPNIQELGMPAPEGMPDPMPQTEPELQTYLSTWQVGAAADLELKILISDVESDIEQLMDEVADDLLAHGYGGLMDIYPVGKRTITERILPGTGLFMPSRYPDYRDAEMGGVLKTVYLDTLLAEAGNNRRTCNGQGKTWSKDDIARIKQLAAASLPKDLATDPELGDTENTGALQVIRWRFRSDDDYSEESYRDEKGQPKRRKAKPDQDQPSREGATLTRATINTLYECTLICGTDLAYNCRKVQDQARDLHNPLKARLGFSLFSAGVTAGRPTSIVRRVKGIVDEMERSWRGYMADMRTYTPEGYNVQRQALQTMVEGMQLKGDNAIMDAYKFFKQTGDTFADLINEEKQQIGTAIQKNPTGIPESAERHLSHLLQQLQLLEAMTGANAVVSAATPGSEAGKGVSQIALQGAANVMAFARTGLKKVYEGHAKNLAGRIWATDAEIPTTGTVPGPDGAMREVGPRKDFHEYMFHMRVELGPSDEEWQELYQKAAQASANGQITVADEMQVKWLRNLKTAQRYMAMAVRRKSREDQKRELEKMQANADAQTQTGLKIAEATDQNSQRQLERDMKKAEYLRETAYGTVERQTDAQERVAQSNVRGKIRVAEIAETGEMARTDADHQHSHEATILGAALAPKPAQAA